MSEKEMNVRRRPYSSSPPRVLSIAGSDPSGGAGIQADLKTFATFGCYGMCALTALTAQNTQKLSDIQMTPVPFFRTQLRTLRPDIDIDAIKIGMLGNQEIVDALSDELQDVNFRDIPVILDPVLVSSSGEVLLSHTGIDDLISLLLPQCTLLTPNLPEARELLAEANATANSNKEAYSLENALHSVEGPQLNQPMKEDPLGLLDLMHIAMQLTKLGPRATLVKGGHQTIKCSDVEQCLQQLEIDRECPDDECLLGAEVRQGQWQSHRVIVIRTDHDPYAGILQDLPDIDHVDVKNVKDDSNDNSYDNSNDAEGNSEKTGGTEEATNPDATKPNVTVIDVLYDSQDDLFALFIKPYIQSTATRGTGCTLSSALAAHIASDPSSIVTSKDRKSLVHSAVTPLVHIVHESIQYVQRCIARGLTDLGQGHGPLNHICTISQRAILAPTVHGSGRSPFCDRLIAHSLPHWRAFTRHPFVQQLSSYEIPRESFVYFLCQDYLFLKHYARAWASSASSFTIGNSNEMIKIFAGFHAMMATEVENHVKICVSWGITRHQLEQETLESLATLAYTRFILDVSRSGGALELLTATGPCLLGYSEAGRWIVSEQRRLSGSLETSSAEARAIQDWIKYYGDNEFQTIVRNMVVSMEQCAVEDPPSDARMDSLQRIWDAAVRLEIGMWDEAMDSSLRRGIFDNEIEIEKTRSLR